MLGQPRCSANRLAFEPQGTRLITLNDACSWSESEEMLPAGFILWRARALEDGELAYVTGYVGGGSLYSDDGNPLEVHWLSTRDGRTFEPVAGDDAVVLRGGASETDFAWLDDGSVVEAGFEKHQPPSSGSRP
ncbi:MAG TPA: hypothetical protein VJN18_19155 [Polyangiaceae bacterium]|nr:hypothetical protein [Polyangiaceae bacterium]